MTNCSDLDHVHFGPRQETKEELRARVQKMADKLVDVGSSELLRQEKNMPHQHNTDKHQHNLL